VNTGEIVREIATLTESSMMDLEFDPTRPSHEIIAMNTNKLKVLDIRDGSVITPYVAIGNNGISNAMGVMVNSTGHYHVTNHNANSRVSYVTWPAGQGSLVTMLPTELNSPHSGVAVD
jgi:hypothetical protein